MDYQILKQFDWMRGVWQYKTIVNDHYIEFFKTVDEAYQYVADMHLYLELEGVA